MKNIKKEKALKFSQEIIDNLPCNMEELLEIKLNEITTEKNVVFENFLKEKNHYGK